MNGNNRFRYRKLNRPDTVFSFFFLKYMSFTQTFTHETWTAVHVGENLTVFDCKRFVEHQRTVSGNLLFSCPSIHARAETRAVYLKYWNNENRRIRPVSQSNALNQAKNTIIQDAIKGWDVLMRLSISHEASKQSTNNKNNNNHVWITIISAWQHNKMPKIDKQGADSDGLCW